MEEWNLFLEGTASYTGDKTYNEGLSGRRAVEVYKYLLSKVSGKHLYHQMSAFGYRNASMAGKKFGVEDERGPALRLQLITSLFQHLGIEPAEDLRAGAA